MIKPATTTSPIDLSAGISHPLELTPGPLLVLGDTGCGKTVVMKKLLKDALLTGADALVYDTLGGSHDYRRISRVIENPPGRLRQDHELVPPRKDPDLAERLSDSSLTHIFVDPIDWCNGLSELIEAFASARSRRRFVAATAFLDTMLNAEDILDTNPSLLLMRTQRFRTDAAGTPLARHLARRGVAPEFLRNLPQGTGILATGGRPPELFSVTLRPEELKLFDSRPRSKRTGA